MDWLPSIKYLEVENNRIEIDENWADDISEEGIPKKSVGSKRGSKTTTTTTTDDYVMHSMVMEGMEDLRWTVTKLTEGTAVTAMQLAVLMEGEAVWQ